MPKSQNMLIRGACGLVAMLLLSSCGTTTDVQTPDEFVGDLFRHGRWRPAVHAPENTVEMISIEHVVAFENGSARMTETERRRLHDFLRRSNIGPDEPISLYGPLRDHNRHDPVTAARIQFVRGELLAKGFKATAPIVRRNGQEEKDGISVVISRSVVITPDCKQPVPAPGHRPRFHMGCSNTANLGQMIADPLDLEQGRAADPADGETAAQSIQRLREREVETIQNIEAESTN